MGSKAGPGLCQVRSETDRPCGRPAAATLLGVRFCERCAREQQDYFAVGELTQVPRGERGGTGVVGYAARAPRSGYPAGPRGGRRGPVARIVKVSLLLVVGALSVLAAVACGGAGQARGGADAADAKAEGNETHGAVARAGDADGAVARAGGAVARTDDAQARTGDAAREEDGGEAPERNAAGEDRSGEERLKESRPQGLTLTVGGDPGTPFSGVCSFGKEEKTIGGRVPERYAFEPGAAGLECEVRKEEGAGALEVVVAGAGVRSVQRTAAGEGTIRFALSGGGIPSSTSSISLNQTVTASDRSSADDSR